jgi:hypothetical protein
MMDEIKRLEQEALFAETWIHVPQSVLAPTRHNEQFWLLHHNYVPKIIATLPGEFAHIASVLHALLATGIEPNHQPCFVDNTWLVSIHRADGTGRLLREGVLACGLMKAMANTLDTGLLTSVAIDRLGDTCTPVTEWIETMEGQEPSSHCPRCGNNKLWWDDGLQAYICGFCGAGQETPPSWYEESDADLDMDVWGALR